MINFYYQYFAAETKSRNILEEPTLIDSICNHKMRWARNEPCAVAVGSKEICG